MTLEELLVQIKADTSQLVSGLQEAQRQTSESAKQMQQAVDTMASGSSKSFMDFGDSFKRVAEVFGGMELTEIINKIFEDAKELFDLLAVEGIRAAMAQEDAINQLNNAFARSGVYSEEASHAFEGFANTLQHTTRFSNDAVIAAGSLIESLGQMSEQGLERATKAAADLASGLGIDLHTAAMLVGRAAEGNITTFQRYGLTIEKGATDAETFSNALNAINEKFGGAAVTNAQVFTGLIDHISHGFEDFQKVLGNTFVQNSAVTEALKQLGKELDFMTESTKGSNVELKKLVGEGLINAIEAAELFAVTLDAIARVATAAFNTVRTTMDGLAIGMELVSAAFGKKVGPAIKAFAQDAKESAAKVGKAFTEDTKLEQITISLEHLKMAAQDGFTKISDGAATAVEPINRAKKAVQELTEEEIKAGDAGKELADNLTKATELTKIAFEEQSAAAKTALEAHTITTKQYYDLQVQYLRQKINQENLLINEAHQQGKIKDDEYFAALGANEKKYNTEASKLDTERLKREKEDNKTRGENMKTTLNFISGLQRSHSKELFFIGQQAAAANAIIDGYAAVQKALASAPPPYNFILAGLVGVATAANVASIESQSAPGFAGGLDSVPGVGFRDNFPALLAPNEGVITSENNKKLTAFLDGRGGDREILTAIASGIQRINQLGPGIIQIQVGGKTITETLNDEIRSGRKILAV